MLDCFWSDPGCPSPRAENSWHCDVRDAFFLNVGGRSIVLGASRSAGYWNVDEDTSIFCESTDGAPCADPFGSPCPAPTDAVDVPDVTDSTDCAEVNAAPAGESCEP